LRRDTRKVTGGITIKELADLSLGVIGFEAAGKLHAEDFDVLLPRGRAGRS
jgi:hypothetical protein